MLNIIKSDLYRILRGKAIYIVLAVIVVLELMSILVMSPGSIGISTSTNMPITDAEFQLELSQAKSLGDFREIMKKYIDGEIDRGILANNVNLYYCFIVVVIIVLCTDFSSKTIKNSLSSAISRKKYYFSKLILILSLGTFIILFNNYFTYFTNLAINGEKFACSFEEITKITLMQLPMLYGMISILVCFASIFRKKSTFNTVAIPFMMVVQIISGIIISVFRLKGELFYNYELQYALTNLASMPETNYIIKCILLGIAYIIVFNVIGYLTFKKAEIK